MRWVLYPFTAETGILYLFIVLERLLLEHLVSTVYRVSLVYIKVFSNPSSQPNWNIPTMQAMQGDDDFMNQTLFSFHFLTFWLIRGQTECCDKVIFANH